MLNTRSKANNFWINKHTLIYVCFFTVITALSFFNLSVYFNNRPTVIHAETKNDYDIKIVFWESFLASHPDYFDGWIELSKLQLKIGNIKSAEAAYDKAKKIKPNANELKELENEFQN